MGQFTVHSQDKKDTKRQFPFNVPFGKDFILTVAFHFLLFAGPPETVVNIIDIFLISQVSVVFRHLVINQRTSCVLVHYWIILLHNLNLASDFLVISGEYICEDKFPWKHLEIRELLLVLHTLEKALLAYGKIYIDCSNLLVGL